MMISTIAAILFVLTPLNPPPTVPDVGKEVDMSFTIPLPESIEGPAITIAVSGATIMISRTLIESLTAASGRTDSRETDDERRALIAASRAKKLLALAPPAKEDWKETLEPIKSDDLNDAVYLISDLLCAGKAVVLPAGGSEPARSVIVRYLGSHPDPGFGFGHISFSTQELRLNFLTISWFAA